MDLTSPHGHTHSTGCVCNLGALDIRMRHPRWWKIPLHLLRERSRAMFLSSSGAAPICPQALCEATGAGAVPLAELGEEGFRVFRLLMGAGDAEAETGAGCMPAFPFNDGLRDTSTAEQFNLQIIPGAGWQGVQKENTVIN